MLFVFYATDCAVVICVIIFYGYGYNRIPIRIISEVVEQKPRPFA